MSRLLETKELTKRFEGLVAVNEVDFCISEGETVGIIGPNGSGKTTFFNLISGFFPPTRGSITFLDHDITRLRPEQRVNLGIGRTFQLVSVFDSLKVWENLVLCVARMAEEKLRPSAFMTKPASNHMILDECREALKLVGLEAAAELTTATLSYGSKRMLEIAISLSLRPKLLLLDEPFAGLSDDEIDEVLSLLHRVKKNFTLIIVEHKISRIVGLVERMYVMNEGYIICTGSPADVLKNPEVQECYWGKEAPVNEEII